MPRFPSIFSSSATSSARSSTHSLTQVSEESELNDALEGCAFILRDDIETAEERLGRGGSSFHKLGFGVVSFMKAALSFESDAMKEAGERLNNAANTASSDYNATRTGRNGAFRSEIYAPGTEYQICQAEAHIMAAVIGVLTESVSAAVSGFLNVRKAYQTLSSVVDMEKEYAKTHAGKVRASIEQSRTSSDASRGPATKSGAQESHPTTSRTIMNKDASVANGTATDNKQDTAEDNDSDDDFVDAPQFHVGPVPSRGYQGHIGGNGAAEPQTAQMSRLTLDDKPHQPPAFAQTHNHAVQQPPPNSSDLETEILPRSLITNPMDAYIHSSTYLFFGLLQLMLSLIPPAMGRLLSIIGFHGDRTLGLSLLWRASTFDNLNGAMAGVILLSYYTGLVAYLDILPASGPGAFPADRCKELIRVMKERYPKSTLMLLQEVRMLTTERQLGEAVEIISKAEDSKLKQLRALQCFEKSLDCMYAHRWLECADGFERCVTLNNWSHGLYIYIAACCHIELYRHHTSPSSPEAAKHATKAEELLHKVPENTGKKRFMSKQLPFDVFVNRKYAKWTARAKQWGVRLADAVGVSPIEEMIFFWGGYARMGKQELGRSLEVLTWSDGGDAGSVRTSGKSTPSAHWGQEAADEHAMVKFLRATVLRQLGQLDVAQTMFRAILDQYTAEEFKNIKNADTWPLPVTRYEMAVCYWLRTQEGRRSAGSTGVGLAGEIQGAAGTDDQGKKLSNQEALRMCSQWLEKTSSSDPWELEARFGSRVSTGKDTLKGLGIGS